MRRHRLITASPKTVQRRWRGTWTGDHVVAVAVRDERLAGGFGGVEVLARDPHVAGRASSHRGQQRRCRPARRWHRERGPCGPVPVQRFGGAADRVSIRGADVRDTGQDGPGNMWGGYHGPGCAVPVRCQRGGDEGLGGPAYGPSVGGACGADRVEHGVGRPGDRRPRYLGPGSPVPPGGQRGGRREVTNGPGVGVGTGRDGVEESTVRRRRRDNGPAGRRRSSRPMPPRGPRPAGPRQRPSRSWPIPVRAWVPPAGEAGCGCPLNGRRGRAVHTRVGRVCGAAEPPEDPMRRGRR